MTTDTYALHTQEQFDEAADAGVRASIALGKLDAKRLAAGQAAKATAEKPFLKEIKKLTEDVEVWRGLLEDYAQHCKEEGIEITNAGGCTVVPKKEVVVDDLRLLCAAIADDESLSTDLVKPAIGPLRKRLSESDDVPGVHFHTGWGVQLQQGG